MEVTDLEKQIAFDFFNEEFDRCKESGRGFGANASACGSYKDVYDIPGLKRWVLKVDNVPSDETTIKAKDEAIYYQKAKEENLEDYFAETYYIGRSHGYDLVLQEKVDVTEDEIISVLVDELIGDGEGIDDIDAVYDNVYDYNDEDRLYAIFGNTEATEKLIDFCCKNNISDLHEGNYGFKLDGSIVITDFAGW